MTQRYPTAPLMVTVLVIAAAYALTLYPGVGGRINPGDSAKFQFIGEVLGVPHEPGYPQYVMLTYLWTRLPLPGELAVEVNLFSAACSVVAAILFYLTLFSVTGSRFASVFATLSVFATRMIWTLSTEAEVYALNLLWVSLFLFLGERWHRTRAPVYLGLLLVSYALSFGNHTSMITLLPAFLLLVAMTEPRVLRSPKWIAVGTVAIFVGISQYAFLVWSANAGSPYMEGMRRGGSWSDLPDAMLARRFTDEFLFSSGFDHVAFERTGELLAEANRQFLLPALLLAVVGGARMWRVNRAMTAFFGAALLGQTALVLSYQISDWYVYCVPVWLLLGFFVAGGAMSADQLPSLQRRAVLGGLALVLAWIAVVNFQLLRVDEPPDAIEDLIAASGTGGVVVTRERGNYHDLQIRNYYLFAHNLRETGPLLLPFETLRDRPDVFLSDAPTYFKDAAVADEYDKHGVDLVASGGAFLREWLRAVPDGQMIVIIANEIDRIRTRVELAAELAEIGLGSVLLDTSDSFYAGATVKGAIGPGVEMTHRARAVLRLDRADPDILDLRLPGGTNSILPWPLEAYAGRVSEGSQSRLTVDDVVDLSPRREIRAFALKLAPGAPDYSSATFDVATGSTSGPYLVSTGTRWPIDAVSVSATRRSVEILRPDGRALVRSTGRVDFAVIGCRTRRAKIARSVPLEDGGVEEFAHWSSGVTEGDWLMIGAPQSVLQELVGRGVVPAARGESDAAEADSIGAVVWRAGSGAANWIQGETPAKLLELGC